MDEQNENQNNNKISDKVKDKARQTAKKQGNKVIKLVLTKIAGAITFLIFNGWPALLAICIIAGIVDFATEIFTAQQAPERIISGFEVEDVADLIQIKEDGNGGYYLDFVDNFDEKAEEIVKNINSTTGAHNVPTDVEFLKKIIKAEVITQFPDLGGTPQGEGFQGSVKIRRVSPDKNIGEMKNTGAGGAIPVQEEEAYDTTVVGSYEEMIKSWETGKKLLIKTTAKVYSQTESELNPGSDTGDWNEVIDETGRVETIPRGTEVEYTGTYKNNENPLTNEVITYVEVKYEDKNVYVRANYLSEKREETEENNEEENQEQASITRTSNNVTSRAETNKEEVGGSKDSYVIAIAAGHNNTDDTGARANGLVEEDLTVEVAQKVQELIEDRFSNVTVVQTGSTPDNRGGVAVGQRKELARNANPDLCIQIHFNSAASADGNGVEVIYKNGDGISQQLAEILTKSISSAMGLTDRGAGPDVEKCAVGSLGIIENAATSGFPSVVTEGGFLSGNVDANVIKNGGVDKYAEGIVNGIKEYLESDHSGYSSTATTDETVTDGINSIVKNLKYVPQETMEQYISEGNMEALNVFTLDEERNLITATWSYANGAVEIRNNSPVNLKTTLQKYVMPYEYLLFYYVDTDYTDFSEKLADTIIDDTEIVIALQDNVTTTQTTTTNQERREDSREGGSYDWRDLSSSTEVTERCSTSVDITYVNTWCVRAYQENSYSSEMLNMTDNETKHLVIKGKVNDTSTESAGTESLVKSENYIVEQPVYNEQGIPTGETHEVVQGGYRIYNRNKITTRTIGNTYEDGDLKIEGRENVFVDLYTEHKMYNRVRTDYLFRILEENERTANLLDLTKYLMYKATNVNYGVIEFDFSIFDLKEAQSISGDWTIAGTIQEKVWLALRSAGFSEIQVAGAMGNIDYESGGFSASAIEGGVGEYAGGIGLCQWTGGRNTQLRQYAASQGKEWTDENIQIEFLLAELGVTNNASPYASIRTSGSIGNGITGTKEQWLNAQTIEDSTKYFMAFFESPGSSASLNERIKRAQGYYEQFKNYMPTGGNSQIVQVAKEIHDYVNAENYTYGAGIPPNSRKIVDCSGFVSAVLQQCGYPEFATNIRDTANMYNHISGNKFIGYDTWEVYAYDESILQPGDILLWRRSSGSGHTAIYAGDGLTYDCGSTEQINSETTDLYWSGTRWQYIIRVK